MRYLYILLNRKPVRVYDADLWRGWIRTSGAMGNRVVAYNRISEDISVSTIFCPVHNQSPEEPLNPQLFKIEVIGGRLDGHIRRVATYEEAESEHEQFVYQLRGNFKPVVELFPIAGLG